MSRIALAVLAVTLCSCGYSSRDNEVTGQFKKMSRHTPLVCPDYQTADLSLGVMRNGTGPMSTQDEWYPIDDKLLEPAITEAIAKGSIVRVKYDVARVRWCVPEHVITAVEVLAGAP